MQVRFGASGVVVLAVVAACLVAVPARADTPSQPVTGGFVPVASTRLVDTRSGTGVEKHQLAGGASLTFAARAGIDPATAVAGVLVNLTVTGARGNGWVTAYTGGTTRPATSTLNYRLGRTIANSAVVGLGTDGTVALYNGGPQPVDVVVDLNGYYLGGGSLDLVGTVRPVTPTRLLDTRNSQVYRVVPAGQTVAAQVEDDDLFPLAHTSAVIINVTASGATATGSLTAGVSSDGPVPATSSLNYTPGVDVAAMAVAPVHVRTVHSISVRNNGPGAVRIVIDLEAYITGDPLNTPTRTIAPPAGTVVPTFDRPSSAWVVPTRVLDTRTGLGTTRVGQLAPRGTVAVALSGNSVVPVGAAAAIVTVTATRATATGHLAVYRGSAPPPVTSTVNYTPRTNVANTTVVPLDAYGYGQVYNGGARPVDVVLDVTGYVAGATTDTTAPVRQGEPADIVVDDTDHQVVVSVPATDSIDVYTEDGEWGQSFPQQSKPEGLLVHDGVLYVANRERGTVDAVDLDFGTHLRTVATIPDVRRLAWAAGRLWATSGSYYQGAHEYRLWSIAASGTTKSFTRPAGSVFGEEIAVSPTDPSRVFLGARLAGTGVSAFDLSSGRPVPAGNNFDLGAQGGVRQLAVSPDGATLTVVTTNGTTDLDATTLAAEASTRSDPSASAIAYAAHGGLVAFGRDGSVSPDLIRGPNAVVAGRDGALRLSVGGVVTGPYGPWTPSHGVTFNAAGTRLYVVTTPNLGTTTRPSYQLSTYDLALPPRSNSGR